jgi:hypothetical protein
MLMKSGVHSELVQYKGSESTDLGVKYKSWRGRPRILRVVNAYLPPGAKVQRGLPWDLPYAVNNPIPCQKKPIIFKPQRSVTPIFNFRECPIGLCPFCYPGIGPIILFSRCPRDLSGFILLPTTGSANVQPSLWWALRPALQTCMQ